MGFYNKSLYQDEVYLKYKEDKLLKYSEKLRNIYNNRAKKYKLGSRKIWGSFAIEDIKKIKKDKMFLTNTKMLAFYSKSKNIEYIDEYIISKLFSITYGELKYHRSSAKENIDKILQKMDPSIDDIDDIADYIYEEMKG